LRELRRRSPSRCVRALAWFAFSFALATFARTARADADDSTCDGPDVCCPKAIVDHLSAPVHVAIGVVFVGFSEIAERSGTWDADDYLYESWPPTPGFTPQTEIVNEVARGRAQFDSTEIRDGRCLRSRRLRSKLRSDYNLRTFHFDAQSLKLTLSDDLFTSTSP
jgi:hypothetical protein